MILEMRKEIPDSIRQIVFEESGYQCAYCGFRNGLNLTIHHIDPHGLNVYENLIALCHNCHNQIHNSGKIKDKEIRRLKRNLVRTYLTQLTVNAMKLAFHHKDGKVIVSPLLMKHAEELGFVSRGNVASFHKIVSSEDMGINESSVEYFLTKDGKSLTQRWLQRGA